MTCIISRLSWNKLLKPERLRRTYLSFLECELRGNWFFETEEVEEIRDQVGYNTDVFYAINDDCEIWLVRQDQLRIALSFKADSTIMIRGSTLFYDPSGVNEELSVNEDEQFGVHKTS